MKLCPALLSEAGSEKSPLLTDGNQNIITDPEGLKWHHVDAPSHWTALPPPPLLCGLIPTLLVSVVPSVLHCQGCGPAFMVEHGGWILDLPMFLFLCEAQPFIPDYRNLPSLGLSLYPALTPTLLAYSQCIPLVCVTAHVSRNKRPHVNQAAAHITPELHSS